MEADASRGGCEREKREGDKPAWVVGIFGSSHIRSVAYSIREMLCLDSTVMFGLNFVVFRFNHMGLDDVPRPCYPLFDPSHDVFGGNGKHADKENDDGLR